jgi:hypothetical protein
MKAVNPMLAMSRLPACRLWLWLLSFVSSSHSHHGSITTQHPDGISSFHGNAANKGDVWRPRKAYWAAVHLVKQELMVSPALSDDLAQEKGA